MKAKQADNSLDRQKALQEMDSEELQKTLRKAEDLRDLLVRQENDLIFKERLDNISLSSDRERIAKEYLTTIDLIETIKKEQIRRQA